MGIGALKSIGRQILVYAFWPGFVGGVVAVAGSLLLRSTLGTATLAEVVTDASTFALGPERFSYLLDQFGADAKPLLFLGVVGGQLALYCGVATIVGVAILLWRSSAGDSRTLTAVGHVYAATAQAALVATALLITSGGMIATTPADLPSRTGWPEFVLAIIGMGVAYGIVTELLRLDLRRSTTDEEGSSTFSRRSFLRGAAGLAAAAGASLFVSREVLSLFGKGGTRFDTLGKPTPEVISNEDFYVVSKNFTDPKVNSDNWSLTVGGSAHRMIELSYDDIRNMPAQEEFVTLQCISNNVGGPLIGNARWKGFPLDTLLKRVEPLPSAQFVFFRCYDDYTETLPLEFARREQVALVHEMNGEILPFDHGFPVRLLAPGKYGIKNPKWITEIAMIDEETFGYWQQRGWSQEARMQTSTRIDVPVHGATIDEGPFRIHGLAFSGDRGISQVQVSVDNGRTWNDAKVKRPLSPYSWSLWHYDWDAKAKEGLYRITARSRDGTGELQTAMRQPRRPDVFSGVGWTEPLEGQTGYPFIANIKVDRRAI